MTRGTSTALFAAAALAAACGGAADAVRREPTEATAETCLSLPTVAPPFATIRIGDTLRVMARFDDCAARASSAWWASMDKRVATIDSVSGLITGRGAGTATIIASGIVDPTQRAGMLIEVRP